MALITHKAKVNVYNHSKPDSSFAWTLIRRTMIFPHSNDLWISIIQSFFVFFLSGFQIEPTKKKAVSCFALKTVPRCKFLSKSVSLQIPNLYRFDWHYINFNWNSILQKLLLHRPFSCLSNNFISFFSFSIYHFSFLHRLLFFCIFVRKIR